jgi:hypothetical protein
MRSLALNVELTSAAPEEEEEISVAVEAAE